MSMITNSKSSRELRRLAGALLTALVCIASFGITSNANAETNEVYVYGKGVYCYEYSMATGLGISSRHHIYYQTNDRSIHVSNGAWAGTYYQSVAPNYGQPVTYAWADFT